MISLYVRSSCVRFMCFQFFFTVEDYSVVLRMLSTVMKTQRMIRIFNIVIYFAKKNFYNQKFSVNTGTLSGTAISVHSNVVLILVKQ